MAPFYKSLAGLEGHHVSLPHTCKPCEQQKPKLVATPKFEPAPSQQQGLFFKLPAEIRNEIYKLVFTPPPSEDNLFPSVQIMKFLGLLFTCRQINFEAMAYAPNFLVTNRWHRADLLEIQQYLDYYQDLSTYLNALPFMLTRLTLVTEKRRPYVHPNGPWEYLDFGGDFAKFVWRVVKLFPTVEKVEIEISRRVEILASSIFRCLLTDKWTDCEGKMEDETKAWRTLKGTDSDGEKCIWLEERQTTDAPRTGMRKRVRRVEVTCKIR